MMKAQHPFIPITLGVMLALVPAARAEERPMPSPLPTASPAWLEPSPEVIRRDPALGVALSVIPGYGLGHFLIGDQAGGIKFLALDLATTFVWALGPAVVSVAAGEGPDKPTNTGFWVFLGGFLAWSAIKVWEATDANDFANRQNRQAVLEPLTRLAVAMGEGSVRFGYRVLSF